MYNAIQANTIVQAVQSAANMTPADGVTEEVWDNYKYGIGAGLVILIAPIIFGGVKRVSKVAERVVPLMAIVYLLAAFYVMITNIGEIPRVISLIINDAFSSKAVQGGFFGGIFSQAMLYGIKRGLYSNEAGQGSAPNAAAAADVKHPASQGLIQMLGVFIDTMVVCSCTAFIILLSDLPTPRRFKRHSINTSRIGNPYRFLGATILSSGVVYVRVHNHYRQLRLCRN